MNPTQKPESEVPEPRCHTRNSLIPGGLISLFGRDSRFGSVLSAIAEGRPMGIQPEQTPAVPEPIAVPGWCERCGESLPWVSTWDEPLCPDCVTTIPADDDYGFAVVPVKDEPGSSAQVLRSTATYLERYGWIQGAYYDATATVFTPAADLVGAIAMVCYGGPCEAPAQHFDDPGYLDFEEAILHLDRYLLAEDSSESYEFNDAKGRTVDQVTHVLREAAKRSADELLDGLRAMAADERTWFLGLTDRVKLLTPGGLGLIQVHCPPTVVDRCACPACVTGYDCASDTTHCQYCGAPGGYPYCTVSFGPTSCADIVATENADPAAGDDA